MRALTGMLGAAVLVFSALPAPGQNAADVQIALDKQVELSIDSATVGEAFAALGRKTGVEFVIDPDLHACLPYGKQTELEVQLKNVTLRQALGRMLLPNAMTWSVRGNAIRVGPTPALLRMNRRATLAELSALGVMHSATLQPTAAGTPALEQLRKRIGDAELDLFFHIEADRDAALARAERALPGTAAEWLGMLCHGKQWTWYLWGDDIMIVDKKMQVARQLQRHVSLRYDGAELVAVLLDLARHARVQLAMEPGVLELLPASTRHSFNLVMSDATVGQALEVISGATGLEFQQTPEGLRVTPSARLTEFDGGRERPRTPFFLKKTIPLPDGSTIELLIRPDDLPDDVKEAIQSERDTLFRTLIRRYGTTTRPATQPAR